MTRTSLNKDWTVRIPVGAYAAALAGSDDPDLRFGAYALPAGRKASRTSARILKRLATAYPCLRAHPRIAADSRGSVAVLLALMIELRRRPPTRRPASINAARSLLAFFVERSIS